MTLVERIEAAHLELQRSGSATARKRLEALQREYRTGGTAIVRIHSGADMKLIEPDSTTIGSRKPQSEATRLYGHPADDVVLRDGFAAFKLDITTNTREAIEAEIRRVRRTRGDVESGGWLFAAGRQRDWSDSITICAATWAGEGASASRNQITLGDAHGVMAELPAHFFRVGDWHIHPRGSVRPSPADMRSWAGTADGLGLRRWVAVIVSPSSEGSGWSIPTYTGWVVQREGVPSTPVCARARLEW